MEFLEAVLYYIVGANHKVKEDELAQIIEEHFKIENNEGVLMTIADGWKAEGIAIGEKRGEKRGKEKWTLVGEIRFAQKLLKQPQTLETELFEQDTDALKNQLAQLEKQLV